MELHVDERQFDEKFVICSAFTGRSGWMLHEYTP